MEITPEAPEDRDDIERLLDLAFGPDRAGKTVYRLRDGVAPIAGTVHRHPRGRHA